MGGVTEKIGLWGFTSLTAHMHLRAQRFRMGGVTEKKVAAQKEEQRQMERRVRYGAQTQPCSTLFYRPIGPEPSILGPTRAIVSSIKCSE